MANTKQLDLISVEELASLDLTGLQIANPIGISRSPLSHRQAEHHRFQAALTTIDAEAILKVNTAVMQEVENSSLRVIILYLKPELAREAELEIK